LKIYPEIIKFILEDARASGQDRISLVDAADLTSPLIALKLKKGLIEKLMIGKSCA
jgi:hypothetical protein